MLIRGVTLLQKVGSTNFRIVWKFGARSSAGARIDAPRECVAGGVWGDGGAPSPEIFSLLTLKKAHFGGYLVHSDVLILKL